MRVRSFFCGLVMLCMAAPLAAAPRAAANGTGAWQRGFSPRPRPTASPRVWRSTSHSEYVQFLQANGFAPATSRVTRRLPRASTTRTGRSRPTPVYGNGELSFTYTGWGADTTRVTDFVNSVYPIIKSIYGAPAQTMAVNIIMDTGVTSALGGTYDPTTNEIRMLPIEDFQDDSYILTRLLIYAFHDDVAFTYDAWEEGFAWAAAVVCQTQVDPLFDVTRQPLYVLPLYELINQPPLGNSAFFPGGTLTAMTWWRLGMAQAAWLKVYTQDPDFFRDFNAAYYAQYSLALAGDVAALKALAGGVTSTVEGRGFDDWYRRQYVLDTTVSVGDKLFIFNSPLMDSVFLELDYYQTTATGEETPLSGTAQLDYLSWEGISLFAQEGYTVTVTGGQGSISPSFFNIGGPQRVTVEVALGALDGRIYYPYGVRGPDDGENEFFGVVVGEDTGTFSVSVPGIPSTPVTVSQGAFAVALPVDLTFLAPTVIDYTDPDTTEHLRNVNVGWWYYVPVIDLGSGVDAVLSHTFPAGVSLISFPIAPHESDEATVFGLSAGQLLLAHWAPNLTTADKYVLYPNTPPLGPGLGYWLKLTSPRTVTVEGLAPDPAQDFRLRLSYGWNQIGSPFNVNVPLSAIEVRYTDQPLVSLATARSNGWVGSVFGYTPSTGYATADPLQPWQGYWIQVLVPEGVSLIFPGGQGQ